MNSMDNLIARTLKNYRVLSCGPAQMKLTSNDVLALLGSLNLVASELRKTFPSEAERETLESLRTKGHSVLVGLERALARSRLNGGVLEGISDIQSQLLEQVEGLTIFFNTLRGRSQKKLLDILSQIQKSGGFQGANVPDWTILAGELEGCGLEKEVIEEEFYLIDKWFKDNHLAEVEGEEIPPNLPMPSRDAAQEEEDLPDYSPGAQKGTIDEKLQGLEQTNLLLSSPLQPETVASSSKSDPPPYTFEDGSDGLLDDDFSEYIQVAIRNEAILLTTQPSYDSPRPWSWLPAPLQAQYSKSRLVHQRMDPHSFSVMAYETAPRCLQEIERLKRLVRTSFDAKHTVANGAIGKAFRSLDVMFTGISKVALLQDQNTSQQRFSDLDTLQYEGSTVRSVYPAADFPDAEIELVRKNYYQVLTYIMGFINAFSTLYTGRTYVMKAPKDLELSWKALNMDARVRWVKKRLSEWSLVENAVQHCRDFHKLHPKLRTQALLTLRDWEVAETILAGSHNDQIELTVISAAALPKTGFRTPTAWARVVLYGLNKTNHGITRLNELKTPMADKTQCPEWNKCFLIDAPPTAKMLQVEVYDQSIGINKELSRVKLDFSSVPGVEANLANRSLLYGLDGRKYKVEFIASFCSRFEEEIGFPLNIIDGKGKEKEQSMLKLGLRWKGRYGKIEEMGLPSRSPGKMFKSASAGLPLLSELPQSTLSPTGARSFASGHSLVMN